MDRRYLDIHIENIMRTYNTLLWILYIAHVYMNVYIYTYIVGKLKDNFSSHTVMYRSHQKICPMRNNHTYTNTKKDNDSGSRFIPARCIILYIVTMWRNKCNTHGCNFVQEEKQYTSRSLWLHCLMQTSLQTVNGCQVRLNCNFQFFVYISDKIFSSLFPSI